jgi:hypothetical protein
MAWTWRYESADGTPLTEQSGLSGAPEPEPFGSQSDAETWLGTAWRELLDAGAAQVTLLDDDRVEYTMPLTPDGS